MEEVSAGQAAGFYCEEEELTDRLSHAEREGEGERLRLTLSGCSLLYILLIPGSAALRRCSLSLGGISTPETVTLKVKLFFASHV